MGWRMVLVWGSLYCFRPSFALCSQRYGWSRGSGVGAGCSEQLATNVCRAGVCAERATRSRSEPYANAETCAATVASSGPAHLPGYRALPERMPHAAYLALFMTAVPSDVATTTRKNWKICMPQRGISSWSEAQPCLEVQQRRLTSSDYERQAQLLQILGTKFLPPQTFRLAWA